MSRPAESRAVSDFLGSAAVQPSGQIIAGEAGIGKTTLWLDGLAQAREHGFPSAVGACRTSGVGDGVRGEPDLRPTERRVADLAAAGLTNRDIAAELFVSVKTVEANMSRIYHKMSRIYRKLGVRSRAELGRRIDGESQSGWARPKGFEPPTF